MNCVSTWSIFLLIQRIVVRQMSWSASSKKQLYTIGKFSFFHICSVPLPPSSLSQLFHLCPFSLALPFTANWWGSSNRSPGISNAATMYKLLSFLWRLRMNLQALIVICPKPAHLIERQENSSRTPLSMFSP